MSEHVFMVDAQLMMESKDNLFNKIIEEGEMK